MQLQMPPMPKCTICKRPISPQRAWLIGLHRAKTCHRAECQKKHRQATVRSAVRRHRAKAKLAEIEARQPKRTIGIYTCKTCNHREIKRDKINLAHARKHNFGKVGINTWCTKCKDATAHTYHEEESKAP